MYSFAFLRRFADIFLPVRPDADLAAHEPGPATPIREERYRPIRYIDLAIWFEDLTECPDRVWGVSVAPAEGMDEEWFDTVLGYAEASERRYAAEGVLSGVRVKVRWENWDQFTWVLRKVSQRLGTNPWIRDLSEPGYAEFWSSREPMFPPTASATGGGATSAADLTNCAIRITEN
jgi:FAD/FMN-containing dehydrogenase